MAAVGRIGAGVEPGRGWDRPPARSSACCGRCTVAGRIAAPTAATTCIGWRGCATRGDAGARAGALTTWRVCGRARGARRGARGGA